MYPASFDRSDGNDSALAPIALFTFRRPEHTLKTLRSLASNPEFLKSPLYVFCDGPRNDADLAPVQASRSVVRDFFHPQKEIVESQNNLGLARSVIAGVSRLCREYGRVIVIEDDIIVSSVLLRYLNDSLARYAGDEMVYQVTGHMWPIECNGVDDAFFMPLTNSLGWATWERAWRHFDAESSAWSAISRDPALLKKFDLNGQFKFSAMMAKQLAGTVDSWAIRWYLTVFSQKGLVLHPRRSLLINIGFEGAGTHSNPADQRRYGTESSAVPITKFPEVVIDEAAFAATIKFLGRTTSWPLRLMGRLQRSLTFLRKK